MENQKTIIEILSSLHIEKAKLIAKIHTLKRQQTNLFKLQKIKELNQLNEYIFSLRQEIAKIKSEVVKRELELAMEILESEHEKKI